MASTRPNPYGMATPLGQGLDSVFGAFLSAPTPEDRAANALKIHGLQAQGKRDLAAAGYDESRTAGQNISNDALRSLPTLDYSSPGAQGTVMQTMDGNYGSLADVFATHQALQPGAKIESMDPIVYAKTGNAGNTFTGFREDQAGQMDRNAADNVTTRRGQDLTYKSNIYGHDRDYAASTQNNTADNARAIIQTKLEQAGYDRRSASELAQKTLDRMLQESGSNERTIMDNARALQVEGMQQNGLDRRYNVNTPAGSTTTLGPGNPLGVTTIKGNPTQDTVHGQMAQNFIDTGGDVNAPISAQTPMGAAFDTKNPGDGGMSLTVGKDGTVQMTQGGAGVEMPTAVVGDNLKATQAIEGFMRTSKELRSIAAQDPTLFGTVGNARRLFQSVAGQADVALQVLGKSQPGVAKDAESVFETVVTDLSMAGVQDPSIYDPNLTDIDKMAILAAYQAAAAIAGQEGRGLSNEDFTRFRQIIGDPTAWGSTQQSFLAGLNRLERLSLLELNARRSQLGQDPIAPATFGQTSTQPTGAPDLLNEAQSAIAKGADRRAVAKRYFEMTGQALP